MSIEIQNLSYTYMKGTPYERSALKGVNLSIQSGEFVGIIGATGSGKSTLIQHFNGLLKSASGKVIIDGVDISDKKLKELCRKVGIVFQYPEHQLFEETVFKDIGFGLHKQGLDNEEINKRVLRTIKIVGLDKGILERSPFELSGGQKRRVAIAGVLCMMPEILVLDEPTAGLDPGGRDEIYNFIVQLHKSMKITIILVSHCMEDIARLVDRVIVLNQGTIEMDGLVKEVFKQTKKLEMLGLSAPQISYLMQKLKKIQPEINDHVITIDEAKQEIIKYFK